MKKNLCPVCLQDEESEAILTADFEIGHFIRERIVPRAVLYFTGEAIEDDDDDVSVGSWTSFLEIICFILFVTIGTCLINVNAEDLKSSQFSFLHYQNRGHS